ncbi:MAG: hypothetical protein Q8J85_07100 [Sulfuricurvum sp.]|nr:hypothetical protein [Sulfuricurvum sp.]MDP3023007.1 hypothetical protein [Sulfuricurvum sp.]
MTNEYSKNLKSMIDIKYENIYGERDRNGILFICLVISSEDIEYSKDIYRISEILHSCDFDYCQELYTFGKENNIKNLNRMIKLYKEHTDDNEICDFINGKLVRRS